MTTIPATICNGLANTDARTKVTETSTNVLIHGDRFHQLFLKVFDNRCRQQLLAQADLSNMLNTIAKTAAIQ